MRKLMQAVGMTILIFFVWGCEAPESGQQQATAQTQDGTSPSKAIAVLHPTAGNEVKGVVTFAQTEMGMRIVATISGLAPGGHGFHIHEYGDCSSGDGKSAGGHFNPEEMEHAGPDASNRHVGDLGNITADEQGNASMDRVDKMLTFAGPNSIIGRGVIVHADPDDLTSQPTGAAGARVACGVIGVAKD